MQCPYCQHHFTLTDKDCETKEINLNIADSSGLYKQGLLKHLVCPNEECKRTIIFLSLYYVQYNQIARRMIHGKNFFEEMLVPKNVSKIYPEYIPQQLREDYEEACKIIQLSPKASATLSRRCLQGIIRDYHGITKSRLVDEVNALQGKIEPDVWSAIDAVRKIGNIGAHMEKDVNVIVDIEPEEAQQLIRLIEMLFDEWYVRREERKKQLQAIQAIADDKDAQKKGLSSVKASTSGPTVPTA